MTDMPTRDEVKRNTKGISGEKGPLDKTANYTMLAEEARQEEIAEKKLNTQKFK